MDILSLLFFAVVAMVVGSLIFRFVKFGGFKAAMFGAPIERTIGEVLGSSGRMTKITVRVHILGGRPERAVGLELVARTIASYQMVPVALSEDEARDLLRLLQSATTGS
jgi:hypothetical protein